MKYPLSLKRNPGTNPIINKITPSEEILDKFNKWSLMVVGFIQTKVDNYPISQMLIQQILDEVSLLLKKADKKSEFEQIYTKLNSLIWNSSSRDLLTQKEYNELNNRLNEFQNELFRINVLWLS